MKTQRIELTDEQLDELADRVAEKVAAKRRRTRPTARPVAEAPVVSDTDRAAALAIARRMRLHVRGG
jgi:hypothetical protein